MNTTRREATKRLVAAALAAIGMPARGQATGEVRLRLLVGYPPGGQADRLGRLAAKGLSEILAVTVVVENRPGANGMIAAEAVARAPADGQTLLVGGGANMTVAPLLDKEARYDPLRDFAPVGRIARVPMVLVTRASLPVSNVKQLLDYARRKPGALTFAAPAANTALAIESLRQAAGVDILIVPYKGTPPVTIDLLAERVDFTMSDVAAVEQHAHSGSLRVIASAGRRRARAFPEVPTMIEQGVAGFEWDTWQAIVAPRHTPADVLARLQRGLSQALAAPELRAALESAGFEPAEDSAEEFWRAVGAELDRNRELVKRLSAILS